MRKDQKPHSVDLEDVSATRTTYTFEYPQNMLEQNDSLRRPVKPQSVERWLNSFSSLETKSRRTVGTRTILDDDISTYHIYHEHLHHSLPHTGFIAVHHSSMNITSRLVV
jgi:hypothetical protein